MRPKPKVFLSRIIPQHAIEILSRDTELGLNEEDESLGKGELIRRLQGTDETKRTS